MALPLSRPTPARSSGRAVARGRERLSVVPPQRRVAWFAVLVAVLSSAVMIGAIGFHTSIAERQLEIDRLERAVRDAQEEFDVLRSKRAELRAPTRLAVEGAALGMQPGEESEFVAVDPMLLAVTIARTGAMPVDDRILVGVDQGLEPLDQFRLVKAVSSEVP